MSAQASLAECRTHSSDPDRAGSTTSAGTPTASSRRSRRTPTSHKVLTLAWMNREALARTARHRRGALLVALARQAVAQGRDVGHVQRVREIRLDCDGDAILLVVEQVGGIACHTGRERCFFQRLEDGALA